MSNTKSLLALTSFVAELERAILENDGELTPELESQFDLATGDHRLKVDGYKYVIDAFLSRAAHFKTMERQVKDARKMFENQAARLHDRLKYVMRETGEPELRGNDWRFKLSVQKKENVQIVNVGDIPSEYLIHKVTSVPDLEAIETALKMGWEVPGAKLTRIESLRCFVNTEREVKEIKE